MPPRADSDDLSAIRRLKAGDNSGLEVLIARYQEKALRTAFLITQDELMAQDVVEEAFIHFFRGAHRFDEARPFLPYFMRSVLNAAIDMVEHETRGGHSVDLAPSAFEELLEQAASVEEQVEYCQLKEQILQALSRLPVRHRAAIVQRYYLQMSEKEMAGALAAPPGTVKWLLSDARNRLRALFGSEWMAK